MSDDRFLIKMHYFVHFDWYWEIFQYKGSQGFSWGLCEEIRNRRISEYLMVEALLSVGLTILYSELMCCLVSLHKPNENFGVWFKWSQIANVSEINHVLKVIHASIPPTENSDQMPISSHKTHFFLNFFQQNMFYFWYLLNKLI